MESTKDVTVTISLAKLALLIRATDRAEQIYEQLEADRGEAAYQPGPWDHVPDKDGRLYGEVRSLCKQLAALRIKSPNIWSDPA